MNAKKPTNLEFLRGLFFVLILPALAIAVPDILLALGCAALGMLAILAIDAIWPSSNTQSNNQGEVK